MSATPREVPTSSSMARGFDLPGQELLGDSLRSYEGTVYHYTDAGGLAGMLGEGRMRASQASSLNDRSEAVDGWRRLHEMLTSEGATDLQSFTASQLEGAPAASARVFVVSASTEPDDVNQWRLYAADGWGYSLAIPPGRLRVHHAPRALENPRREELYRTFWRPVLRPWIKVIYTDEQLRDVVQALIQSVKAAEEEIAATADHDEAESEGRYETLGQWIDDALATIAYLVKPAGFRGENEVRTVVTLKAAALLVKGPARTVGYFPPFFRSGPSGIVGYFELGWAVEDADDVGRIPWEGVVCGPRHRHGGEAGGPTVHDETIKMLSASKGLKPTEVRTSDISLR